MTAHPEDPGPQDGPTLNVPSDAPPSTTASALFDLRSVIALLFGVYGIVLLIMGLVSGNDPANLAKTGGLNLNLDVGIAMVVLGLVFVAWVRLRPLTVPTPDDTGD